MATRLLHAAADDRNPHPMPPPYDAVYDAVLFDLDGTLVSEREGVERSRAAVAALVRDHGHDVSDAQYSSAAQQAIDDALAANHGSWPATFSRREAIRRALIANAVPADLAAPCELVYKRERMANLALLPDARDVLDLAQARGPLGLISNGDSAEQREKLRRCALTAIFRPARSSRMTWVSPSLSPRSLSKRWTR